MADLTLKQGSPEWHAYRKRALTDLFWLCDVVLGYGQLIPMTMRAHRLMAVFAERRTGIAILDEAPYQLIKVPREVGKTSIVTVGRTIQRGLANPDSSTMIANERQENADAILYSIKQHLENNAFLRALFPDVIPADPEHHEPWAATKLSLIRHTARKEPTFFTIGVGGTATGSHPDSIVCDDLVSREAMENARMGSWSIMEKVNRWVNQLQMLLNHSAERPEITFIGTNWWVSDSYDHIERAFGYNEEPTTVRLKQRIEETGETQVIECVRRGDLAMFVRGIYENGTSFFPEKFPDDMLAKMRMVDPELFAANMLNAPASDLTAQFKSSWLRYFSWADPKTVRYQNGAGRDTVYRLQDLDVLLSVDPAFGTEGKSRQAIVVTGSTEDGARLILKATATKQAVDAFVGDIVETCRQCRPRKLIIERAGQQIAFIMLVQDALRKAGLGISVEDVSPGGRQKDVRIQVLEPHFQRGLIYAHRDQTDFLAEYQSFPRGEFKDLLDALAYQAPFWRTEAAVSTPAASKRIQEETARVYERMGRTPPVSFKKDWRTREDGSRR